MGMTASDWWDSFLFLSSLYSLFLVVVVVGRGMWRGNGDEVVLKMNQGSPSSGFIWEARLCSRNGNGPW